MRNSRDSYADAARIIARGQKSPLAETNNTDKASNESAAQACADDGGNEPRWSMRCIEEGRTAVRQTAAKE